MSDTFAGVDPFVPQAPAPAPRPTPDVFTPPPELPMRELADPTAIVFPASKRHLSTAKRAVNEVRLEWNSAEGGMRRVPMPMPSSPGTAAAASASTQTLSSPSPATTAANPSVSSSSPSLPVVPPESRSHQRVSRARVQEQDGGVRLAGGPPTSFVDPLEDENDDTRTQYSTLPPPYSDNFV